MSASPIITAPRTPARPSRRTVLAGASAGLASIAFTRAPSLAQTQPPREGRTLIKNGVVLTMDSGLGDFERADVLVEGGKIAAVRPDISAEATVIDASNRIVLPGFTDTHHHFYQSAMRNLLGNGLLEDYFRDIVAKATPLFRAGDAYDGVLSGALRSLTSGVTHVVDMSQVSNSPEHSDAMIKAFRDSGIRAVYAYARGYTPAAKFPDDVERIKKQHFASNDGLVSLAFTAAPDKNQWLLARKMGLRIYAHVVGLVPNVGPADVIRLGDEGLMGPDNVYVHFTGGRPEYMKRIKDTGGALSLAVPIEMTMRHGTPPISYDHGAQSLAVLLDRDPDVEAIFAVSDLSAVGAVMECQRRGIAVPDDLSIMGFGDFEIGREINPPLTSIHVDFRALGQRAGQAVRDLLSGKETARRPIAVDVGLSVTERASVKAAP